MVQTQFVAPNFSVNLFTTFPAIIHLDSTKRFQCFRFADAELFGVLCFWILFWNNWNIRQQLENWVVHYISLPLSLPLTLIQTHSLTYTNTPISPSLSPSLPLSLIQSLSFYPISGCVMTATRYRQAKISCQAVLIFTLVVDEHLSEGFWVAAQFSYLKPSGLVRVVGFARHGFESRWMASNLGSL